MISTKSLLVPVYNGAKFIYTFHNCIQRLDQKFDEVLFYDDGSSDQSHAILTKLGYPVIRSEVNLGQAAAKNILLKATKANWVHFHDIDDFMYPEFLTEAWSLITNDRDAIICDAEWIDENDSQILIKWEYKNKLFQEFGASYLLRNPIGGINGLYKRDTLIEIGGFDDSLRIWEDSDLNLRLALNKKNIVFTETVLVKALRHSQSASVSSHKIREYKCVFLSKYLIVEDPRFVEQIRKEADQLFHEIVYNRDWDLYNNITAIFKSLGISPPLTKTKTLTLLKYILGPKYFTMIKYILLKYLYNLKIVRN